ELRFRLWVDPGGISHGPWPVPYLRGLGHLVFAGFDSESSAMIDLKSRRISGRFSPEVASDQSYWKRVIFPRLLTALGPSIGVIELHCACVSWNGRGIVLFGAPGAGKSTLALALARQGWSLMSEDWTYFSRDGGAMAAWGIPSVVKLLPDAIRHFPELGTFRTTIGMDGEEAYRTEPERTSVFRRRAIAVRSGWCSWSAAMNPRLIFRRCPVRRLNIFCPGTCWRNRPGLRSGRKRPSPSWWRMAAGDFGMAEMRE